MARVIAGVGMNVRFQSLRSRPSRIAFGLLALGFLVTVVACGGKQDIPTGVTEADKFLFERGTEELNKRRWFTARQYFTRLVDNYPQSPHRPDAKLGIGDSYLGEGTTETLAQATSEFREFLNYFPTHRRADYAQYKLGYVHYARMRGPARDQTETRAAIAEWELFVQRYPNSPMMAEVRSKLREARDRVATSEYQVGLFYYRQGWYPAAVDRFKDLLGQDPLYTSRDAVYYYLGESLIKSGAPAEALPYFDRLVREFETSEYLLRARSRLDEHKSTTSPAPAPEQATTPGTPQQPTSGSTPPSAPQTPPVDTTSR
jgi:outer membrane protein assembly factor BamD